GKVARIVVADETGRINVVLWDDKTAIVSQGKLSLNQEVRVFHGYVKEGLRGMPELNVSRRGTVAVLSQSESTTESNINVEERNKICDLKEGDVAVNIIGIVRGISPMSVFERKDGTKGSVMRVSLADGTGRVNMVLWDEAVESTKKIGKGVFFKLINGQVKKGMGGGLEVHTGRFSQITVLKEKPENVDVPTLDLTKISELNSTMADVDVLGRVVEVGQVREFTRSSGETGRVADLYLIDETGSVRLSLWDNKANALEEISVGDTVLVESAYVREGSFGTGLNLGKMGALTVNPDIKEAKKLPLSQANSLSIGQLKMGLGNAIVEGVICEEPVVRTVTTRDGQEVDVASLRIRDQTGEIRVSLWRDLAEKVRSLPLETAIRVKNVYVRTGFDGSLELSSRSTTEVEIIHSEEKNDTSILEFGDEDAEKPEKISELEEGDKVNVKGKIVEFSKSSQIQPTCPRCKRRIQQEDDGKWVCDKCGEIPQPVLTLVVNALIEDSSGGIVAVFKGSTAEKLLGMTADYAWNIATQTGDERSFIEAVSKKLIGKTFNIEGKVRAEGTSGNNRLIVESIK
ncbi:MAG: hypothetical protein QG670_485, partial [Thermoproteota archaeon]|nr:hypothetical protein [Thermoproteota archaeon]